MRPPEPENDHARSEAFGGGAEPSSPAEAATRGGPLGRYRWLICALLFFATTVNYIDRQILSLLKPMLDDQLRWTNEQFGEVNAAFQGAYAVGLLALRRLHRSRRHQDRIRGIHRGVEPGGHRALRSSAAWAVSSRARVALGFGEGGNFPSAIKAVALWFPKRERAFATALFNSGANVGAIVAPAIVPCHRAHLGLARGVRGGGHRGPRVAALWIPLYNVPERIKRMSPGELAHIRSDADARRGVRAARCAGWPSCGYRAGLVVHRRQVPDRSGVVVLPHLAARLLQEDARARHQEELGAPGDDLRDRHGAEHRRRLAGGLP